MNAQLECPHPRHYFDATPKCLNVKRPTLHPLTWSRDILCDDIFSESERATLVTVMWTIWTSRNNITHDKAAFNPSQSMRKVRETLAVPELPSEHARTLSGHGWRPPELGWIKINIDGSIAMDARRGGTGGVARSRSSFLAAWCKPYLGVTDPLIAEALAIREESSSLI